MARGAKWVWLLVGGAFVSARAQTFPCPGVTKRIHLTFDDGPADPYTNQVLNALKNRGVKATFFVMGDRLKPEFDSALERTQRDGHLLASHTYRHINSEKTEFTMAQVKKNIEDFYVEAKKLNARRRKEGKSAIAFSSYVRMPYGAYFWNTERLKHPRADELRAFLAERKLRHVLWNVDSQDYTMTGVSPAVFEAKVLRRLFQAICDPESPAELVVLFHDIQPQTAAGIDRVIQRLRREGQSFTTLEDAVLRKDPGAKPDIHPRDPTFDPIAFPHHTPEQTP